MEKLLELVRELVPAAIWSAGVELARTSEVVEVPSMNAGERSFRIVQGPQDKAITVALSDEDQAWQSDCACPDDPCRHVVGTVLALKQGKLSTGPFRRPGAAVGQVVHAFSRVNGKLEFRRFIDTAGERRELVGSLGAALRSIRPGDSSIAVTRQDEEVDHVLPGAKSGALDLKTMRHLCAVLSRGPTVLLDGVPCSVSSVPARSSLEVVDDGDGFRISLRVDGTVTESFENGLAVRDGGVCPLSDDGLHADEWRAFSGAGKRFSLDERVDIASVLIPSLQSRVEVEVLTKRLPHVSRASPRVLIETVGDRAGDTLTVIPHIVYGEPPFAKVGATGLQITSNDLVPIRDRIEESRLAREVQTRLLLRLHEAKVFRGEDAINFTKRLGGWEVSGDGRAQFTPATGLTPVLIQNENGVVLGFETKDGRKAFGEGVVGALSKNGKFVRLDGGGWGELPTEWLSVHREAALRLLSARGESREVRASTVADIDEICTSLNVQLPEYMKRLRQGLEKVETIDDVPLPSDLQATLRPYQRVGVNWLSFMRQHQLGALLADDMGLGKTLQAITVLSGRTLVVAPTSVLYSWEEQIRRFRPNLHVCRYHGGNRVLDPSKQVLITTYALLRMEIERFESIHWDTIVLDESQQIRNPESQVAQAAFRLKGDFKLNLSGTPVENSLEDVWSQLQFLNPGLLGTRSEFEDSFGARIREGDGERANTLRRRIAPFMLRRLKRDVERDLPPKTEVVLECELSEQERGIYNGVMAASRSEVMTHLESSQDLLSIFEVLLRLRQACCHPGLVPGQSAHTSSKISLLQESLESSISQGHRALVFSQWTSLLDVVEPALNEKGISWSRIDGATQDRGSVVSDFQRPDGPSVLLLSLKAGGVGLNLTAADHVYILDPWWNPAVEDQAADRAYRIGQERPVIVHRLVARDTIEERVLALQASKRELGAAIVGTGQVGGLSRDDILMLISD